MVWARTIFLHRLQANSQLHIEVRIVDVTHHVVQPRLKVFPPRLTEVARVFRLGSCPPALLAKLFRTHRGAADPENFELRVHTALTCEVIQTGDQLPFRQIARNSKNNQDTRISGWQSFLRQLLEGAGLDNRRHKFSLSIDALNIAFESPSETNLLQRILLHIIGSSFAGALSHMNDNSTFFEAHFIHQCFHQVNPATMSGFCILRSRRIRYPINVKSWSFVLYRERYFARFTAATNMDVLSGVLMISVKDCVCERVAQCDLNVALAFSGTAALPDQSHESIHEGRNRLDLA